MLSQIDFISHLVNKYDKKIKTEQVIKYINKIRTTYVIIESLNKGEGIPDKEINALDFTYVVSYINSNNNLYLGEFDMFCKLLSHNYITMFLNHIHVANEDKGNNNKFRLSKNLEQFTEYYGYNCIEVDDQGLFRNLACENWNEDFMFHNRNEEDILRDLSETTEKDSIPIILKELDPSVTYRIKKNNLLEKYGLQEYSELLQ